MPISFYVKSDNDFLNSVMWIPEKSRDEGVVFCHGWGGGTPYDDLLNQIADREPARVFGAAALKTMPNRNAANLARVLRGQGTLAALAESEPAKDRVTEVSGWVVPNSVARYAALAAAV